MKARVLVVCIVLGALVSCSRTHHRCEVCQRDECTELAFRVTLEGGKTIHTCCPRCGLHYAKTSPQAPRTYQATDYTGKEWIDATKAVYVSGSDVSHCASKEIKRDAQGCCLVKGFDRCLPSLIAFTERADAESFQKKHGGELVTFDELSLTQAAH